MLTANVDCYIVFAEATYYVSSVVATGGAKKELKDLRGMMKYLTASVTAQASTLASLSVKTNSSSGGGGGQNTDKKKVRPGLHMYAYCKREEYHKEGDCLELEANNSKRCVRWKRVME